jgi:hypothetical protein
MDRVAALQNMVGTKMVWTSAARPCRSSGCDPPPACVVSRLAPKASSSLTWLVDCQRAPCPSAASEQSVAISNARRQLRSARTSSPPNDPRDTCLARRPESMHGASSLEKESRISREGDHDVGVLRIFLKAFRNESFRQLLIRGSQPPNFTPPSLQPCQA